MRELIGKYRGTVENNTDAQGRGRIQVKVPHVLGDTAQWALPCVPYAGPGIGMHLIPPNGAHVWVEFEGGDPDRPVWTGCFWGENEQVPASPASPDMKVIKTGAVTITINDAQGSSGITIERDGMKIVMNSSGIEITTGQGKIKLSGNQVSVNDGALEVT